MALPLTKTIESNRHPTSVDNFYNNCTHGKLNSKIAIALPPPKATVNRNTRQESKSRENDRQMEPKLLSNAKPIQKLQL
ncbi:hypothetical protein PN499_29250 [Kamptonema animale CS-326]|uniref:hypothetical protein n=1 Tax=Kamptonema animale TaxID=92934 RepID=UPI00233039E8|nr:hypothetical protein [Kamptonema animale]MDB9515293.1 hypothetical protein [Kamptonema animale CS-326]